MEEGGSALVANGKLNQVFDAAYSKFHVLYSVSSLQVCKSAQPAGSVAISALLKLLATLLEQILARLADCFSYASLDGAY